MSTMESLLGQAWDLYTKQREEASPSLNGTLEDLWHKIAQMEAPTPEDEDARLEICADLSDRLLVLGSSMGGALSAEAHGSFVMGCYSSSSALEVAVTGKLPGTPQGEGPALDVELRGTAERLALLERVHLLVGDSGVAAQGTVSINRTARLPSVSFEHASSGIPVRLCIAYPNFALRAQVVRGLVLLEPRLRSLVQLVELWADARGLNNPAAGTFNSWALVNLVIFSAQTFQPQPLLPPLWRVCGASDAAACVGSSAAAGAPGAGSGAAAGAASSGGGGMGCSGSSNGGATPAGVRPTQRLPLLHTSSEGLAPLLRDIFSRLSVPSKAAAADPQAAALQASALLPLFHWFLVLLDRLLAQWQLSWNRRWRVSTWHGQLVQQPFNRAFLVPVECPFDPPDNAAKSLGCENQPRHQEVFRAVVAEVAASLRLLQATKAPEDLDRAVLGLFGLEVEHLYLEEEEACQVLTPEQVCALEPAGAEHPLADHHHHQDQQPQHSDGLQASPPQPALASHAGSPAVSAIQAVVVTRSPIAQVRLLPGSRSHSPALPGSRSHSPALSVPVGASPQLSSGLQHSSSGKGSGGHAAALHRLASAAASPGACGAGAEDGGAAAGLEDGEAGPGAEAAAVQGLGQEPSMVDLPVAGGAEEVGGGGKGGAGQRKAETESPPLPLSTPAYHAASPAVLRANAMVQRPLSPLLRDVTNARQHGPNVGAEPKGGAAVQSAAAATPGGDSPGEAFTAFEGIFGTILEGARRLFDNVAQGVAELGEDLNELAATTAATIRAAINDDEDQPFMSSAALRRPRRHRLQLLHRAQPGAAAGNNNNINNTHSPTSQHQRTPGTPGKTPGGTPGQLGKGASRQGAGSGSPKSCAAGAEPLFRWDSPASSCKLGSVAEEARPLVGETPLVVPGAAAVQQQQAAGAEAGASQEGELGVAAAAAAAQQPTALEVRLQAAAAASPVEGGEPGTAAGGVAASGQEASCGDSSQGSADAQGTGAAAGTEPQAGAASSAAAAEEGRAGGVWLSVGEAGGTEALLHPLMAAAARSNVTAHSGTGSHKPDGGCDGGGGELQVAVQQGKAVTAAQQQQASAPAAIEAQQLQEAADARAPVMVAAQQQQEAVPAPAPEAADAALQVPATAAADPAGAQQLQAPAPALLAGAQTQLELPAAGAAADAIVPGLLLRMPSISTASTCDTPTLERTPAADAAGAPSPTTAATTTAAANSRSLAPTPTNKQLGGLSLSRAASEPMTARNAPPPPPPLPPPPRPPVGMGGLRVKSAAFRKGPAREALVAASVASGPAGSPAGTGASGLASTVTSTADLSAAPARTVIALSSGRLQELAECIDRAGPCTTIDLQGVTFSGPLAASSMKVTAAGLWLVNGELALAPEQQLMVVAKAARMVGVELREAAPPALATAATGGAVVAPATAAGGGAAGAVRPALLITKQSYAGGGELVLSRCRLVLSANRGVGMQVKGKGCSAAADACHFQGTAVAAVHASDASLTLTRCSLQGGGGHGMCCRDNGAVMATECVVDTFGGACAAVAAGGSLELIGCTFRGVSSGGDDGAGGHAAGAVVAPDAVLVGCESAVRAIATAGGSSSGPPGGECGAACGDNGGGARSPGGGVGVLAEGKGSAVVARGSSFGWFRSQAAVVVTTGATASLEDCKATDSQQGAVVGTRGGRLLATRCELAGHAAEGLLIGEGATADLRDCKMRRNGTAGLRVGGVGSMAVMRGCEAAGNAGCGVAVEAAGCASLDGCTASANGGRTPGDVVGYGLLVEGAGARTTAHGCTFSNNSGAGVAAGAHANVQLVGCRMESNGSCGGVEGEEEGVQVQVGAHGRVSLSGGCVWGGRGQGEGETGSGSQWGLRVAQLGTLEILGG